MDRKVRRRSSAVAEEKELEGRRDEPVPSIHFHPFAHTLPMP